MSSPIPSCISSPISSCLSSPADSVIPTPVFSPMPSPIQAPAIQIINSNDESPPFTTYQKTAMGIGCGLVATGSVLCAAQGATQMLCVAGGITIAAGLVSCGVGSADRASQEG